MLALAAAQATPEDTAQWKRPPRARYAVPPSRESPSTGSSAETAHERRLGLRVGKPERLLIVQCFFWVR